MKIHALLAALLLAAPATTFADRKITYRSDRDGDGHYVKRTKTVSSHGHSYGHGYHGHSRYYGSSYYGHSYARPYYYGGWARPYYYSAPAVTLSFSRSHRSYADVDERESLEMDVQQALRRHGYYRGQIDGDIGPGSRSAIRDYQADRGLPITGRVDGPLLRSLGL